MSSEIGDFYHSDGASLDFEVYRLSRQYGETLLARLKQTKTYSHLSKIVSPEVLDVYWVAQLCQRFISPVRQSLLNRRLDTESHFVMRNDAFYPLFCDVWDENGLQIHKKRFRLNKWNSIVRTKLEDAYFSLVKNDGMKKNGLKESSKARISVEAVFGVHPMKRSDVVLLEEEVDPARLLLYFEYPKTITPVAWHKGTLRQIEERGMQWICLRWNAMEKKSFPWSPGYIPCWTQKQFLNAMEPCQPSDIYEQYNMEMAIDLLREIDFWRCFFRTHNIKIQLLTSTSPRKIIPQRVAMDLEGGLLLGKQRSYHPPNWDESHAQKSQHVFFTWGEPEYSFNPKGSDCCNFAVVSGFSYDHVFLKQEEAHRPHREQLKKNGVRFTVALLDNAWGNFYITRAMIVQFYTTFLQWLLKTPDAGLVLKPKRTGQLKQLPEIHELLNQALATGRCVWLQNETGRLASDASSLADLTVGIYFSSAVLEAAIAGHRAVHWDVTRFKQHPFYQWGYRKVVFDDLNDLLSAIHRFKEDPRLEPDLGDHKPVIKELDPYRDHQGGRRITEYVVELLKGFDKGSSRREVVAKANQAYVGRWGMDKIVSLREVLA